MSSVVKIILLEFKTIFIHKKHMGFSGKGNLEIDLESMSITSLINDFDQNIDAAGYDLPPEHLAEIHKRIHKMANAILKLS